MNKTKRKIFETSMKLFAKKGYEATSIEEITATVGVAKGTLYYHCRPFRKHVRKNRERF